MRKTNLSKKISIINYFISALGNLKKGTDTNKLLLKVWFLSSTITFIISVIALAMIGTLNTDTLMIKITIYGGLFGISSILPSLIFGTIYYTSLFILEPLNKTINFIYLLIIREIKLEKLIKVTLLKIMREFRLSKKEISLFNINQEGFIDKALNSFLILKNSEEKEFKHTSNVIDIILTFSTIIVLFISVLLSGNDVISTLGFSAISVILFYLVSAAMILTMYLGLKIIKFYPQIIKILLKLPIIIYERVKRFFREMKEEYKGSKIEINNYIEARVNED